MYYNIKFVTPTSCQWVFSWSDVAVVTTAEVDSVRTLLLRRENPDTDQMGEFRPFKKKEFSVAKRRPFRENTIPPLWRVRIVTNCRPPFDVFFYTDEILFGLGEPADYYHSTTIWADKKPERKREWLLVHISLGARPARLDWALQCRGKWW